MKIELDEGYFFGLGVFETIYIYRGKTVFLEEHLKRLINSLQKLNIKKSLKVENLKIEVNQYLKANFSSTIENQVLKIIVSEKNIIFLKREYNYNEEKYEEGFNMNISETIRNEKSIFSFHKTLNYADNIFEKRKSQTLNFDEPLFLNSKNQIAEGATSNIFFVKENKIYTPNINSGILNGIIRNYILKNFQNKFTLIEKEIYFEDLEDYEEVFLTNSLFGVMPVNKIEKVGSKSYKFNSRKVFEEIFTEYKKNLKN